MSLLIVCSFATTALGMAKLEKPREKRSERDNLFFKQDVTKDSVRALGTTDMGISGGPKRELNGVNGGTSGPNLIHEGSDHRALNGVNGGTSGPNLIHEGSGSRALQVDGSRTGPTVNDNSEWRQLGTTDMGISGGPKRELDQVVSGDASAFNFIYEGSDSRALNGVSGGTHDFKTPAGHGSQFRALDQNSTSNDGPGKRSLTGTAASGPGANVVRSKRSLQGTAANGPGANVVPRELQVDGSRTGPTVNDNVEWRQLDNNSTGNDGPGKRQLESESLFV
jgi:hypothetical protein